MTRSPSPGVGLVCLDVDGTLLGASGVVSDDVWRAIEHARAAGLRLAMCSGRPGFGVTRALAQQIDADGWHCFQNGASVLHLASGRSHSTALAPETIAMLVARARTADQPLELYTDDDYATESGAEVARAHAGLLGLSYAPRSFDSLPPPIVRAQWLLADDEVEAALAEPHPGLEISPSLGPMLPGYVMVNLTRTGVDKGSAVRTSAAEYGVDIGDVMYVGDGFNDTPALRIVGWPVAMANSEPPALALARHFVGSVDEDGVAEALELAVRSRDGTARANQRSKLLDA
jgi:Cof subfamily protein (haloacid dehalogenase superfamily)